MHIMDHLNRSTIFFSHKKKSILFHFYQRQFYCNTKIITVNIFFRRLKYSKRSPLFSVYIMKKNTEFHWLFTGGKNYLLFGCVFLSFRSNNLEKSNNIDETLFKNFCYETNETSIILRSFYFDVSYRISCVQ